MRLKLVLVGISIFLMLAVGVAGGRTMALFTANTSTIENTFTAERISVVSWRAQGDYVPHQPPVQWNGWPAPIFYTTEEEGAYHEAPEGKYPTGVWAPGDSCITSQKCRPGFHNSA